MKLFIGILISCCFIVISIVGCSSSTTYASELNAEKADISSYISHNGIQTISTLPTNFYTSAWPSNQYYLSSTGLYYRLSQAGDSASISRNDTARIGDEVMIRYVKVDLTLPYDTVEDTWTTLNSSYPYSLIYGVSSSTVPSAWQEAISYMKCSGSIAELIVPATLGSSTDQSDVTAYYYKLLMKKLPR
jgi:hypothetical protein